MLSGRDPGVGFNVLALVAVPFLFVSACGASVATRAPAVDGGVGAGDGATAMDVTGLDAAPMRCTSAAQCDDGVGCTVDVCMSGACVHTPDPARCAAGASCDVRHDCQTGHVCATDLACADTDPCTTNERCDGATRVCRFDTLDGDMDGFPPRVCGGGDCDDINPAVHPGATELCNGIDDNCNGVVDEPPAGMECGTGFGCTGGHCACTVAALQACGGACVDLQIDANNCGACGQTCAPSAVCNASTCHCAQPGATPCGAACVDLMSDAANCGACGTSCGTGHCDAGHCATAYPSGPYGTAVCATFGPVTLIQCTATGEAWRFDGDDFFTNNLTVISIVSGWCVPCQMESSQLEAQINRRYAGMGVRVVQVLEEGPDHGAPTAAFCSAWVTRYGLSNPELTDPPHVLALYTSLGMYPAHVIIDHRGQIRYLDYGTTSGLSTLQSAIDATLAHLDDPCR